MLLLFAKQKTWVPAFAGTTIRAFFLLAADLSAVVLRHGDHRAARRQVRPEVRPARRGLVERRPLARVLHGDEQRLAVRRELGPAHLGAVRSGKEAARRAALVAARRGGVQAIVEPRSVILAVGRDPDAAF